MATATDDYRLLIGGEWVPGFGGAYGIVNPATEETFAEAPEATAADAEAAAAAARAALPGWKRTSPEERANLHPGPGRRDPQAQRRAAPADHGRDRRDAVGRLRPAGAPGRRPLRALRPGRPARTSRSRSQPSVMPTTPLAPGGLIGGVVKRQPVGVVACIAPYNFPLTSMAGKVGPGARDRQHHRDEAAAAGPARASSSWRGSARRSASRPASSTSSPARSPRSAPRSSTRANVDMISFTGSTAVGCDHLRGRGPDHEAAAHGARRQGRVHRLRRRRRRRRRSPAS